MNRYDNIELSTYTPRSLQETLMVPMMRRQQHDDADKQLQNQIIELNKINPLDKHYNEAQRIKSELTNTISSQAEKLSKEGFNNSTTGNIFKTNRTVSDMYSPTGAIGQMNTAKLAYEKDSDEYLKSATALGHSPQVVQQNLKAIQDEYNASPVYDKSGKINSMNINSLPPKYIDYYARAKDLFDKADLSSSDIENMSSNIVKDSKDGSSYVLNTGSKTVNANNRAGLQAAVNFLNTEILNPNSDVGKSLKYGRVNPEDAVKEVLNLSGVFAKSKTGYSESSQISNYNPAPTAPTGGQGIGDPSLFGEDYNTTEISGKTANLDQLSNIGSKEEPHPFVAGSDMPTTVDKITDPRQRVLYENTWKQATTGRGIMLDGKLVHISKSYQKLGKNDDRVREQLLRSIRQSPPITLTSKLLTNNQVLNNQGFIAGLGKTADDVDKNMRRQLQLGDKSGRKLIDPKTGKTMSWNEAVKEYGFKDIGDVNYQGQISAHNWEEDTGLGSNTKFSPHVVTIKDDNNVWHSFKTTRINSDNVGGNISRQNDLTKNYRNATMAVASGDNNFQDFETTSSSLKGIKIKYSPSETEVDSETGEPKSWTIKFSNGVSQKTTESKYMNWVNSVK